MTKDAVDIRCMAKKGCNYEFRISDSRLNILSFIDVCLTLPCGVNAKCEAADGKYSCTCPENMEGDPKMKCEGIYIHSLSLH